MSMWSIVQPGYVNDNIVRWEVIQNVALGLRPEGQETCDTHSKTHDQRHPCRVMGDSGKAIKRGLFKGAIDEKAVVICGN